MKLISQINKTSVGLPNEKYLVENAQKILDLQTNFYYYDNANLQMAAFSAGKYFLV